MPKKPLTIVPVTLLHPASTHPSVSPAIPGQCTINLAHAEIILQNGLEERIIQTVLRELINR